jgi:ABC-type polysaccharide/polyol phosphate export permease
MRAYIRELYRYRELLYMIAWREIKVKYKQSIMGFLWAIFMPIIIVGAGILVKYALARISGTAFTIDQIATVSVKSVPWAFFISATRFSTHSLLNNANLVTKIYFPKAIFPIASISSQLLDFLVAGALLVVVLAFMGVGLSAHLLWVPVLLVTLILFTIGLGTLLSAASLFFRDVKYIVEVILTFAIFFTPVFYEVAMFERWASVLMINPIAPILESLNNVIVLQQPPPLDWLGYSFGLSAALCVVSLVFFRKVEPYFAESI